MLHLFANVGKFVCQGRLRKVVRVKDLEELGGCGVPEFFIGRRRGEMSESLSPQFVGLSLAIVA